MAKEKCKCLRCGYEWEKRTKGEPKQCVKCKRYDWAKEGVRTRRRKEAIA
jgi:predicted Zn-ribbon and HTH transcriptional regulator